LPGRELSALLNSLGGAMTTAPLPAVFPGCRGCARFGVGPAQLCLACARSQLRLIPADACPICGQRLDAKGSCPNGLCHSRRRQIGRIHAIAYQAGPLRQVINDYKYRGARSWSVVLGRLLLAWLDENLTADQPDLIVANPSFVGPGAQLFAHTEAVLDAAAAESAARPASGLQWHFDTASPRAIVKSAPTLTSADSQAWFKRASAADLRAALAVPDPARIEGRFVLVYDDICTTGGQLDAVADCLISEGGAARVEGVVLARALWRGTAASASAAS
jgi:predicted amidophosphoribosyltransferase